MARNTPRFPQDSRPPQQESWPKSTTDFRFFDRNKVTFDAIRKYHEESTRQTSPGVYLVISHRFDISHFTKPAIEEPERLDDGKGRGVQLHGCLMVDAASCIVQGTVAAQLLRSKTAPMKESRTRAVDLCRENCERAGRPPAGSQWIHMWDRGGEDFETLCHVIQNQCDWLIRAGDLDRTVQQGSDKLTMQQAVSNATVLGSRDRHLRARQGVPARVATLQIRSIRVTLPKPKGNNDFVKSCGIDSIAMNVVVVEELQAQKGFAPVHWILLTSLPVETFNDAWAVLEHYEKRWLTDEYHRVLKEAGRFAKYHWQTAAQLEPLIGLISLIGGHLLCLKTIWQHEPEAKAADHVLDLWLTALTLLRPKLAKPDLTVYEFFRGLAMCGGFMGRKNDGDPGWQTVWSGYETLHEQIEAIMLVKKNRFRP